MNLCFEKEFDEYFRKYPFIMIDIGASGGAVKEWARLGRHLRVVGFEPDEREYINLSARKSQNKNVTYLNTLVHKEYSPKVKFNLYAVQQLSSLFQPNVDLLSKFGKTDTWRVARSVEVKVDSLDNQLRKNNIEDVDFVKIDTQGSELAVLEGAKGILDGAAFGVYVEAEFTPVYKDQPLFSDVDTFLRRHGFQLFEIIRSKYWKRPVNGTFVKSKGQIMYGDMLYLRSFEHFDNMLKARPDAGFRKSKLLKAAAIAILYDHMDYALEILQELSSSGLIDEKEQTVIRGMIDKNHRFQIDLLSRLPGFRGKARLAQWLSSAGNMFKKKEDRWIRGTIWK